MDINKIAIFIKSLRIDNKMSQNDLAKLIPVDRSIVSKWERAELMPGIDKMKILCNIFNISIDELISGELNTKYNKKEHQNNLFNFLLNQDSRYRRLRIYSIISVIITIIVLFSFLTYYFFQTHNTEKIYRIYGMDDNYTIDNGLLVITREKAYLKIGSINNKIEDITLYYIDNGEENIIYKGSSDLILTDLHGYDVVLNNSNFDKSSKNLYLRIDDRNIKLELSKDYNNKNYVLKDWDNIGKDLDDDINKKIIDIIKIKKDFECHNNICSYNTKNESIIYSILENIIYIKNKELDIQYYVEFDKFSCNSEKMNFTIINNKFLCNSKNCDNYKEIYDKYYSNFIKKYLI